jgi:hypothetical protein
LPFSTPLLFSGKGNISTLPIKTHISHSTLIDDRCVGEGGECVRQLRASLSGAVFIASERRSGDAFVAASKRLCSGWEQVRGLVVWGTFALVNIVTPFFI